MAFYVCHTHRVAFPEERLRPFQGHLNIMHKDDPEKGPPEDYTEDEVPDGYELQDKVKTPRKRDEKSGDDSRRQPTNALSPDAQRLTDALVAFSVPDETIDRIVRGFLNIEELRNSSQSLFNWLQTNITDQKMRPWLGHVVASVFPPLAQPQFIPGNPYGQPMYQPMPPYPTPYQPMPGYQPQPQPFPFPARLRRYEEDDDERARPSVDPATTERLDRLEGLLSKIVEDKEAEEQARRERERMQPLYDAVAALQRQIETLSARDERPRDAEDPEKKAIMAQLDELSARLSDMQKQANEQRYTTLMNELQSLRQAIATGKDATGRTTEDILSDAIPILANKLETLGKDVKEELHGIRTDTAPKILGQLQGGIAEENETIHAPTPVSRSTEEVLELADAENEIMSNKIDTSAPANGGTVITEITPGAQGTGGSGGVTPATQEAQDDALPGPTAAPRPEPSDQESRQGAQRRGRRVQAS